MDFRISTRTPVIKPTPLPTPQHKPSPRLASLCFPDNTNVQSVLDQAEATYPWLLTQGAKFVAKPDSLIKRRGKSGLLALDETWPEARQWIKARANKPQQVESVTGVLRNFLVEPFVPHEAKDEFYININSAREGDYALFYHEGGVDIGDVDAKAAKLLIAVDPLDYPSNKDIATLLKNVPRILHDALIDFISRLYAVYCDCQFTYLEINPLVVLQNSSGQAEVHSLDLAGKLDQTADFERGHKWAIVRSAQALGLPFTGQTNVEVDAGPPIEFPAPFGRESSAEEAFIAELDAKAGASLKLTVLNANARIWCLVAGGGASVVYADATASSGFAGEMGNYGEYSGAPTEIQTYHYAKTLINLMLKAPKYDNGKVLFVSGGIANFTNIASTFKGAIRAFRETAPALKEHKVAIWVRRGGPNHQEALKTMRGVGVELGLDMHVYGPDMHVSGIVSLALLGAKTDVKEFGEV